MEAKQTPDVVVLDLTTEGAKNTSTLTITPRSNPTKTPTKSIGEKRPNSAISSPMPVSAAQPKTRKKNEKPHVLIWICSAGHGGRGWKMKNPRVIGIYGSKEEAEAKKSKIIEGYEYSNGDRIVVGDSWEDEIDLLIRPAEECTL
jgi:hypothetical protein